MAIERGTASKVYVRDINDGKFIKTEQRWEPNYIITPLNEKISRVRVMATVVSRFVSEDQKYASLTLDDASDTITVRAFRDDIELLRDMKPGDIVDVVGKIKEYNEEKYIAPESIVKIEDPNWELVRKLELLLKESGLGGIKVVAETKAKAAEQPASTPAEEVVEETVSEDPKLVILNLIEKMDEGEGVKYVTLLSESGLEEEKLESVLNELMGDGEVYEPKIGRFKRV